MLSTNKIFIIAEAGVNHNGDLKIAKKLIDEAVNCKANAIKFQTWKKGELTGKYAKKIDYIKKNTNSKISRYQLSNSYRLKFSDFIILKEYCKKKGIIFLTTPDGLESLNFVNNVLNVEAIKIGSTELNNLELLKAVSKTNKDVILSTGMGTLKEVRDAVKILKMQLKKKIYLLQCTSEYPTIVDNVNLKVLESYKKINKFIGFSDHTTGYESAMISVAYGVRIIEKHFTLNNNMIGPDHKSSLNPKKFKIYINKIRMAEKIIGNSIKQPTNLELRNLTGVRRGAVAARNIKKGEILKKNMIAFKRPLVDIHPKDLNKILGKKIVVSLKKDQPIFMKIIN